MMMEGSYRPKGWLGLIMGTRLYYAFHGKELEDDEALFETRMDALTREIGDRGKPGISEAVPPAPTPAKEWAPTPAPAPALAPAPTPAPAPRATPASAALVTAAKTSDRSFTPSMQTAPTMHMKDTTLTLPLMERLLEQIVERDEAARQDANTEKAEVDKLREEVC